MRGNTVVVTANHLADRRRQTPLFASVPTKHSVVISQHLSLYLNQFVWRCPVPVVHPIQIHWRPITLHKSADVVQQAANVGLLGHPFHAGKLFAKHPGKQRGL